MRLYNFRTSRLIKLSIVICLLFLGILVIWRMGAVPGDGLLSSFSRKLTHSIDVPRYVFPEVGNFETEPFVASYGPGEGGKAHSVRQDQILEESRQKSVYGFNQLVSDEISLNRTIPELREDECKHWNYPEDLPTASVILVFHNEGWSTLFRTIHSVLNRSPEKLLHEIVLIDDKSELLHLHEQLDAEILKPYYAGRVRIVRNKEREGLIRSRNNGAIAASGDVVVFLDAHCEVGLNWLPPLLAPILEDSRTLSVPIIDGIQWSNFEVKPVYARNTLSRGIFEWGMFYKETNIPQKEINRRTYQSQPYDAPTHAGGLFAIKRDWFKELGWYDPGLWVWGGENFELSFKVWMCGGRSVWVPCSHVAHVYRGHSCSSCGSGSLSNKFNGQPTTLRNYKRVIETWFDPEYKEYFYTREPLARFIDMGDISAQLEMKKRLKCKSFDWFMKEVAYDVFEKYPRLPPNVKWGDVRNTASRTCLDTRGSHPPTEIVTSSCHGGGGNQMFRLNAEGQLTSGEWCSEVGDDMRLRVQMCTHGSVVGSWEYQTEKGGLLYDRKTGKCLGVNSGSLEMVTCDSTNPMVLWEFKEIKPYWKKN